MSQTQTKPPLSRESAAVMLYAIADRLSGGGRKWTAGGYDEGDPPDAATAAWMGRTLLDIHAALADETWGVQVPTWARRGLGMQANVTPPAGEILSTEPAAFVRIGRDLISRDDVVAIRDFAHTVTICLGSGHTVSLMDNEAGYGDAHRLARTLNIVDIDDARSTP